MHLIAPLVSGIAGAALFAGLGTAATGAYLGSGAFTWIGLLVAIPGLVLAGVGQFVRAGTLMMAVVPLDTVHIVANFKETQLRRMKIGQRVRITVDAYADKPLAGTIESLAPASGARFRV